ncbi:MAG: HD domain-containing protein, partial [Bacillota bacterium]|nr:HD domain-containing protein [Bacillota bacterium]
ISSYLLKYSFKTFIVGGSIRDIIMLKKPKDWDLATDALPEEIVEIFKKTEFKVIDISKKHGTIILIKNNKSYEITTFRVDGDYDDFRRPKTVKFVKSIEKDLSRRDFTINSLAYSNKTGLIDLFSGKKDIENKIIRCVGIPEFRFNEDSLRILRAIRFSSELNFMIESKTLDAIKNNIYLINSLSKDRIRNEFNKILLSDHPIKGLILLKNLKILEMIIPEIKDSYDFNQYNINHNKDVFFHTLDVVKFVDNKLVLRLAALLHDIGKPKSFFLDNDGIGHFYGHHKISREMAKDILERYNYPNEIIIQVLELINEHMVVYRDEFSNKAVKDLMNRVNIDNLVKLQIADIKATANPNKNKHVFRLKKRCENIVNNCEPMKVSELDINGYDLLNLGFLQNKIIGEILNYLLEIVLEKPELNKKQELYKIIKRKWLI